MQYSDDAVLRRCSTPTTRRFDSAAFGSLLSVSTRNEGVGLELVQSRLYVLLGGDLLD